MTYTLYWIREDGQGDYDMGQYPTEAEATAAIKAATAELIDQCPAPATETNPDFVKCRDEILAGTWSVQIAPGA